MKKIILSAIAISVFGFANAQEKKSAPQATFGLKGGLNLANFTEGESSSRGAYHVGAFAEIPIAEKFAIQPEILYSAQGAKEDGIALHLDYITIPVLVKFYPTEKLALEFGPQIGFLVNGELTDGENSADVKSLFNTTDFSLNLGVSYDVSDSAYLGLRYNRGLTDLLKDEYLEDGEENAQNSVFQISFGYRF